MKIYNPKSLIKQKRTWFIIAAIILLAFVCGWVASSIKHTETTNKVNQAYNEAKTSAKFVSSGSKASRDNRLAAIETLSKTQIIESCNGEWWSAWYGALLPSVRTEVEDCNAKLKQLSAVSSSAAKADAYLDDDLKVAKTLAVLKIATGSNEWQKTALSSVQSALRDIEAIAVTGDNKSLIVVSKEKLTAIINGWNALNEASAKEDKVAYQKAEGELTQAYANLGAISDASDERVEKLLATLQAKAYKL